MSASTQVKLSTDRARQLRAFAEQEGTSMSGAVGKLFKALYAHTDIHHDIPSVTINTLADGVAIKFPDSKTVGFSFDAIGTMVNTIREYLAGEHAGKKTVRLCDPESHAGTFAVWRKGNGIKIAIPASAPEKNFSPDLLEDFADILEAEIAKSKA